MCIRNLDKLNLGMHGSLVLRLKPILGNGFVAPKIAAQVKSGQKRHENNHLNTFSKDPAKSLIHFVHLNQEIK